MQRLLPRVGRLSPLPATRPAAAGSLASPRNSGLAASATNWPRRRAITRFAIGQGGAGAMLDLYWWGKRALAVLGTGVGVGLLALGVIVKFQAKLIYVPRIPGVRNDFPFMPDSFGMDYEDVNLTAADGTRLHAWFLSPPGWGRAQRRARPAILFLQENAGNMALRLPFLQLLLKHLQCCVLALSYRGYGLSEGTPSERGLQLDTQAALEHLLAREDVDPRQVSVVGKSLGGATALHLAAANPGVLRAAVVENTFTSIEDMAPKMLPFLRPFVGRGKALNLLVTNKWRNYEAVARVRGTPLLLLSALQDEMLPPSQMAELHQIAKGAGVDVTWVDFPEAHHMDAYEVARNYWPAVVAFLQKAHQAPPQQQPQQQQQQQQDAESEDSTADDFEKIEAEEGGEGSAGEAAGPART